MSCSLLCSVKKNEHVHCLVPGHLVTCAVHKAARAPGTSYGIGQLAKRMSIVFVSRHKVTSEHGTREQVTREQSMDTGP